MSKTATTTAAPSTAPAKVRPPVGWMVAFYDANDQRTAPMPATVIETGDCCLKLNVHGPGYVEAKRSVYHVSHPWHEANPEQSRQFGGWDWLPPWGPETLKLLQN